MALTRISKTLFYISKYMTLKFHVNLNNTTDYGQKHYLSTYNFRCGDTGLFLETRDYLTFEYINKSGGVDLREKIFISPETHIDLMYTMKAVVDHYKDDLFISNENGIVFNTNYNQTFSMTCASNKFLVFSFITQTFDCEIVPGVAIILNNMNCYAFLDLMRFRRLYQFIKRLNMPVLSQSLITFAFLYENVHTQNSNLFKDFQLHADDAQRRI